MGLLLLLLCLLEEAGIYFVLRLDDNAASFEATHFLFMLNQRRLSMIHLVVLMLILALFARFEFLCSAQSLEVAVLNRLTVLVHLRIAIKLIDSIEITGALAWACGNCLRSGMRYHIEAREAPTPWHQLLVFSHRPVHRLALCVLGRCCIAEILLLV